ncbi:MAG TPA: serine/threonine-protein kinase, partial [Polyangiaceae bacterium]|nr:serine/threonine-protein kinase [Polyangiaceae bacterium]
QGEDLAAMLRRNERLPPALVIELFRQIALALDRTHAIGIVHRDLKPENLFVTRRDDGTPSVKVLDFGIAKLVSQATFPNTTRSVGTPLYMSPEQVRGDGAIGPATDIYALGQIAYTLLVGSAYWDTEGRNNDAVYPLLLRIVAGATEPASQRAARAGMVLTNALDQWFTKATAAAPSQRFESASELTETLALALGLDALREPSRAAHPRTGREHTGSGKRTGRILQVRVAAVIVTIALMAGIGFLLHTVRKTQDTELAETHAWTPSSNAMPASASADTVETDPHPGGAQDLRPTHAPTQPALTQSGVPSRPNPAKIQPGKRRHRTPQAQPTGPSEDPTDIR